MVRKAQPKVKTVKPKERKIKRDDADGYKKITDFFAVRRSERTVSNLLKKFESEETERAIIEGDEGHLYVCLFEGKGRGIRTSRKLRRGEFVVEYKGDLLERHAGLHREKLYSLDENIGCYMYYFEYGGKQYCVDATAETPYFGRLVNHSYKKPNCAAKVVEVGGVPRLILTALRTIDVGEELLYNYGERDKEVIAANPWLVNS
uniref:[histone H4]-lysine(20) N-methyltransferase n=1 Tax=Romanomermis culicivorax TaxID=13658 RepID=A0A915KRN0_ROMCU